MSNVRFCQDLDFCGNVSVWLTSQSADITNYCHPERSEGPASCRTIHTVLLPFQSAILQLLVVARSRTLADAQDRRKYFFNSHRRFQSESIVGDRTIFRQLHD